MKPNEYPRYPLRLRFRVGKMHSDGTLVGGDNADSHTDPDSPDYGTICFHTPEDATNMTIMVHELAHLQTPFYTPSDESPEGWVLTEEHSANWVLRYVMMLRGIDSEEYGDWLREVPCLIPLIYGKEEVETGETGSRDTVKSNGPPPSPAPKEGQERENQTSMEAPTRTEPK